MYGVAAVQDINVGGNNEYSVVLSASVSMAVSMIPGVTQVLAQAAPLDNVYDQDSGTVPSQSSVPETMSAVPVRFTPEPRSLVVTDSVSVNQERDGGAR